MHQINSRALASILALSLTPFTSVYAQTQTSLYGFKISPSVNVKVERTDDATKTACIPARTTLIVIGQKADAYNVALASDTDITVCNTPTGTEPKVLPKVSYTLPSDTYKNAGFATRGATYGALVVPFKYQLRVDKQFTGSASIGGYAGYRFEWLHNLGFTATPIAFMGASSVPVKGDTADSTKNLMGFTYGLGLVGTFQNSFQSGVVLGWDRVGKNDGYKYNGKPWIALQIGYAFLQ